MRAKKEVFLFENEFLSFAVTTKIWKRKKLAQKKHGRKHKKQVFAFIF